MTAGAGRKITIVAVSDTHGRHERVEVPPGDIFIHCGDITRGGRPEQIREFNEWLGRLPHPGKVVIAGNHDEAFEYEPERARPLITNAVYLEDSEVTISGLRIWGSPWQPEFNHWHFNLPRGAALKAKWDLIPAGIDILVTHGPPHGILDRRVTGKHLGCIDLRKAAERIRPRVHVFGHIHEAHGVQRVPPTIFANASILDERYEVVHPPIVLRLRYLAKTRQVRNGD